MSNAPSEITLSARNLTRSFGAQTIIHGITLELRRGEVLGLLGHNGAGKSTTLQMLTGCLLPNSGEVEICGINLREKPAQAKTHIGYLPETPPLYRELSVNDYLTFAARIRGIKTAKLGDALSQTIQRCGLESVRKKTISTLSKGYQQRVGIAQAIVHHPAVIVLDEPTVGLDPTQIRDIRNLIRELGNTGSVILSTHLLNEVESVCDRVEIMQKGRLIYSDSSVRMQHYGQVSGFIISLRHPPVLSELQSLPGVSSVEQLSANQFRILHLPDDNPSSLLLGNAAQNGWQLEQLTPLHATLEDIFVKITGEKTTEISPAGGTSGGSPKQGFDPCAVPAGGTSDDSPKQGFDPSAVPAGGTSGGSQKQGFDPSAVPAGGTSDDSLKSDFDPSAVPAGGTSGGSPKQGFDPSAVPAGGTSGGSPKQSFDPSAGGQA